MERANIIFDTIVPAQKEIKKRSINYLKRILKKRDGKRLELLDECGENWGGQFIAVTYDGGRHPEYNANICSQVKAVFLGKDGNVYLDIDDDDEYSIDRLNWNEIFDVANYIYDIALPYLKENKQ